MAGAGVLTLVLGTSRVFCPRHPDSAHPCRTGTRATPTDAPDAPSEARKGPLQCPWSPHPYPRMPGMCPSPSCSHRHVTSSDHTLIHVLPVSTHACTHTPTLSVQARTHSLTHFLSDHTHAVTYIFTHVCHHPSEGGGTRPPRHMPAPGSTPRHPPPECTHDVTHTVSGVPHPENAHVLCVATYIPQGHLIIQLLTRSILVYTCTHPECTHTHTLGGSWELSVDLGSQ